MKKVVMERRAYQDECLEALKDAFLSNAGRALYVLATGLGKTYVAIIFLLWLIKKLTGRIKRRPRVLVLCHQLTILKQLKEEFEKHMGTGFSYGLLTGKDKPNSGVDVLFAMFQSMAKAKALFGEDYFDIIIVDEGHHSMADGYLPTLNYFKPSFKYSMTATPNRMDLRDMSEVFGKPVYSKRLPEALAERLLPDVIYKFRPLTEVKSIRGFKKWKRMSNKGLNRVLFKRAMPKELCRKVADEIIAEMRRIKHPKVIIFCQDIAMCREFNRILTKEKGVERVGVVHSEATGDTEETIKDFKAGRLDILIARDILNEGKDLPAVNLVACVRSTGSITIFEQQLGRGLRPGKPALVVLDFVGNCERIAMVYRLLQAIEERRKQQREAATQEAEPELQPPFAIDPADVEFEELHRDILEIMGQESRRWTKESGAQAFRDYAEELCQRTLTRAEMKEGSKAGKCPSDVWLTDNFSPTIGESLRQIGLESVTTQWTLEAGSKALVAYAASLDKKTLTQVDIGSGSGKGLCPPVSWVVKNLAPKTGYLGEALKTLGLIPVKQTWTREDAIAGTRAYAAGLNKETLDVGDLTRGNRQGKCPSYAWVVANLAPETGSLEEALKVIGLKPAGDEREQKIASLLAYAKHLNKDTLSKTDIDRGSKEGLCPSHTWVSKHLGSTMAEAMQAIGLQASKTWSRDEGIAALRTYAEGFPDGTLTSVRIQEGSKVGKCPGYDWVISNLAPETGKGQEAMKTLGLVGHRSNVATREDGIASLLAYAKSLNQDTLSTTDIESGSKQKLCPSVYWVLKHLAPETGSIAEALVALGLSATENWTYESGAQALRDLAKSLRKRTLKTSDINKGSRELRCPSYKTVLKHYAPRTGTIAEAMKTVGLSS